MSNWLERTELLLGEEKLNLLRNANVLVVGVVLALGKLIPIMFSIYRY